MIKGIIFDLDGVLVDTAKYHYQSWKAMANELGFDFTEAQNEELKGIGRMESLDKILSWGGYSASEDEKKSLAAKKNDIYKTYIQSYSKDELLPGVLNFLQELNKEKMPYALGSASRNASYIIDSMGIRSWFVDIIDGNRTTRSKPDPQVFELGATAMGLSPSEIVVFEDSQSGLLAARHGGFKSIGIGSPDDLTNTDVHLPGFEGVNLDRIKTLIS